MSTSIAILSNNVNNQDNCLKQLMSQQMGDKSESDEIFSSSDGDPEGMNRNNGSIVYGQLKPYKRGRNK